MELSFHLLSFVILLTNSANSQPLDYCNPPPGPSTLKCINCAYTFNEDLSSQFQYQQPYTLDCVHNTPSNAYNVTNATSYDCGLPSERYCQATVILASGEVFVAVSRACATECVATTCGTYGYGMSIYTCTSCCNTDNCNSWADYGFFNGDIKTLCKNKTTSNRR